MLKLNASYSKKVPAGEEYSSQSYHASVEAELHGNVPRNHEGYPAAEERKTAPQGNRAAGRQNDVPASPKQLSYLLDLARQRGVTPQQIAAQHGVPDVRQLSKRQCSELINSWRAA